MTGRAHDARPEEPLLSVRDLTIQFRTEAGLVTAVDGVDLDLRRGEVLGLVGESGSGKSVTALSLMRLLPPDVAVFPRGRVLFQGQDLLRMPERRMRSVRGRDIGMVFQEPMTSLNPIQSIGDQVGEPLRIHLGLGRKAARDRAAELLAMVAIPEPRRRLDQFPHELSGGLRQRVVIAMAVACEPKLIIADEPTTALDVTTQAQILELLGDLRTRLGAAIVLITHDLGVVAEFADRVQVMYAGRAVEQAPVAALFENPRHPYTRGLLRSIPELDVEQDRLVGIEGVVPSLANLPPGCAFAPRCTRAQDDCRVVVPDLAPLVAAHRAACFHPVRSLTEVSA